MKIIEKIGWGLLVFIGMTTILLARMPKIASCNLIPLITYHPFMNDFDVFTGKFLSSLQLTPDDRLKKIEDFIKEYENQSKKLLSPELRKKLAVLEKEKERVQKEYSRKINYYNQKLKVSSDNFYNEKLRETIKEYNKKLGLIVAKIRQMKEEVGYIKNFAAKDDIYVSKGENSLRFYKIKRDIQEAIEDICKYKNIDLVYSSAYFEVNYPSDSHIIYKSKGVEIEDITLDVMKKILLKYKRPPEEVNYILNLLKQEL